jgi:hypothetical protein
VKQGDEKISDMMREEQSKPPRAYCDTRENSGPEVGIDETGMCEWCRKLRELPR